MAAVAEGEGKKLVKSIGGYRMIPVSETCTSPFTLAEPMWIPDAQCAACTQCQAKFGFMNRRHHCRRCGKCFCNACCEAKVELHRMLFVDPVRQCAACYSISKKEHDFFERHVKALSTGSSFCVSNSSEMNDNCPEFMCKLSADHRYLTFENESQRLDDIMLTEIESLQILPTEVDSEGNALASGLAMRYKDSCGEHQVIKMVVAPGPNKRQGQYWIASMQKAFKMIYNTRASTP